MENNKRKARSIIPKRETLSQPVKKEGENIVTLAILRGICKKESKTKYNPPLCSHESELKKMNEMLEQYKMSSVVSYNLLPVIEAFQTILQEKGATMKSVDLRNFRRNLKREIDNICASELHAIIRSFVYNHYNELEMDGDELDIFSIYDLFYILDIWSASERKKVHEIAQSIYLEMSNSFSLCKK